MGERTLWGLGHVEVHEGVELPDACGGGDGEQKVAGLYVGIGQPELDGEASLVEQVADVTEAEEGPENVLLLEDGVASAVKSEQKSLMDSLGVLSYFIFPVSYFLLYIHVIHFIQLTNVKSSANKYLCFD